MKAVARALASCFILALGCSSARGQDNAPHSVFVFEPLVAALDSIADTATVEHFRCLLGGRVGDTLIVAGAYEPKILHADYNTVNAEPCHPRSVGDWHNHLAFSIPMADPHNRQTPVEPWSVCELSPPDRRTTLAQRVGNMAIISVANGVHCAWIKADDSTLVHLPWRTASVP